MSGKNEFRIRPGSRPVIIVSAGATVHCPGAGCGSKGRQRCFAGKEKGGALPVGLCLFLWCCFLGCLICGSRQQFNGRRTLSWLRGDDRQAINRRTLCASRPPHELVQCLGLQMRIAPEHLPVFMTRDQRHLLNREPALEQAAGAFVTQVVKV
jgi:hypothetical protein